MENNEMKPKYGGEKEKYSFLKPNMPIAILIYVVLVFFIGAGVMYLLAGIVSSSRGLEYQNLINVLSDSKTYGYYGSDYLNASYFVQGIANFITYLIAMVLIVFFTRNVVVDDFKDIIRRRITLLWLIPLLALAFTAISYGLDTLVSNVVTSSNNQNTIVEILKTDAKVFMIINSILFAPVVEELIFRKCIFSIFKKRIGVVWCYVISTVLFAMPHMLSTPIDGQFGIWMLKAIPYFVCGGLLCAVYHLSNYNIYASIFAHVCNNVLAVILVFAGM